MTDETRQDQDAVAEDPSAAAPPDTDAAGASETSFTDAEAPGAGAAAAAEPQPEAGTERQPEPEPGAAAQPQDDAAKYLELARRTQADFENYRKRMARENAAAGERGAAKLAKELLPALDHLEIALKAAEGHPEVIKGFGLVRDELLAALAKSGIQAFAPQGEPFDPNEHEAMAQQPSEDAESGTVLQVYQQGYRMNGQILRPARVVVAQ